LAVDGRRNEHNGAKALKNKERANFLHAFLLQIK
jgi:hypothetical protein